MQKSRFSWYERFVNKYAPHTDLSLLKLKSAFYNIKLDLINKDPNEQVFNLEGLRVWMSKFKSKGGISDKNFMIHMLNYLPEE